MVGIFLPILLMRTLRFPKVDHMVNKDVECATQALSGMCQNTLPRHPLRLALGPPPHTPFRNQVLG